MTDPLSGVSWAQQWLQLVVSSSEEPVSGLPQSSHEADWPEVIEKNYTLVPLPEQWSEKERTRKDALRARLAAELRWSESLSKMPMESEEVLLSLLDWGKAMRLGDSAEQCQEEIEIGFTRSQIGAAHRVRAASDYAASALQLKIRSGELVTRSQRIRSATIGRVAWINGIFGLEPQELLASGSVIEELQTIEREIMAVPTGTPRQRALDLVRAAKVQVEKWQTVLTAAISDSPIGSEWVSAQKARERYRLRAVQGVEGRTTTHQESRHR